MASLKIKRGGIKQKLTTFIKFVAEFEGRNNLSDVEMFQLNDRLNRAENLLEKFEEIQIQMDETADDLEIEYVQRKQFEDDYFNAIAKAKKIQSDNIHNEQHSIAMPPAVSDSVVGSAVNSQQSNSYTQNIKLPTIALPNFDGNFLKWLEFRDTYVSLIHDNDTISNIQKFHYLRASLSGEAKQQTESLEFTASNYEIAWGLVRDRYDNNKLLIHNHVKSIFEMETVQKESAKGLRAFVDGITKNLEALKQLNQPTENWDTLIIYIISQKLDITTLHKWEDYKVEKDVPSLLEFKSFLKSRAELLETITFKHNDSQNRSGGKSRGFLVTEVNGDTKECVVCKSDHYIQNCGEFLKLNAKERSQKVKTLRLCLNCLRRGHSYKDCRGSTCKKCNSKHHTLIHFGKDKRETAQGAAESSVVLSGQVSSNYVLLATAMVQISDKSGNKLTARALLDSGSQASYICEDLVKKLDITTNEKSITVLGLNNSESKVNRECTLKVESMHTNFSADVFCFVIPKITENLPSVSVNMANLNIPTHLKLADPHFHKPNKIQILLGAQLFWRLMCIGQIELGPDKPILQKTRLGWVLSGPCGGSNNKTICHLNQTKLQIDLAKFWELEEVPFTKSLSSEELECETHFVQNTARCKNGRFIVALPLKCSTDKLGDSYATARKRFLSLEHKLEKKPEIKIQYRDFINEYVELGHMRKNNNEEQTNCTSYYMPHHCVMKESLTTKLRVVFDASCPTTSGYSLNNLQMCGPTLQNTLFSILIRFRQHEFVVAGDIAKMYRQIKIKAEQTPLQRILWRNNPDDEIETYELNTVTYGTTAASFLSIRCLFQLAYEIQDENPKIAEVIMNDFYVDDMLTGAQTVQEAAEIVKGVRDVLSKGCFELRKMYSNNSDALKYFKSEEETNITTLEFKSDENAKTLGLIWQPSADKLKYNTTKYWKHKKVTKRTILSGISQVFDPLGLLSPVMISIKILLQQLWLEKLSWDESVPLHIANQWMRFCDELSYLDGLNIERFALSSGFKTVQIHGFSDVSEKAYGAAIFLRSTDKYEQTHVHLLCAKSKVAPLKIVTLPRLELSGALVLARLLKIVLNSLTIKVDDCVLWIDSTIVLGWLKLPPNKLKTFVSNRVSEIQELTREYKWNHVSTKENPADFLSRGVMISEIDKLNLWWHGPAWLKEDVNKWPTKIEKCEKQTYLPDVKTNVQCFIIQNKQNFPFENFSKLKRMQRVVAWILRFKNNVRARRNGEETQIQGSLTSEEIKIAFERLIKIAQNNSFSAELHKLTSDKSLHYKSRILSLNLFLDQHGLLRVGGRLNNSNWGEDKKHPILLCSKHPLTILIFRDEHERLMHCGPQQVLASIRERFWPVLVRNLAKLTVRNCVRCFRVKPVTIQPIMGSLPASRLQPGPPFNITGLDYAGPLLIKDKKGRGGKLSKCYVGLFICFATKAIHLELVSDLSKDGFLMALRRFVSRRGIPAKIYSDNGKNFVAAQSELKSFQKFLTENKSSIYEFSSCHGIKWSFIPPYSPHFGGLWEAGVKSAKKHLKAVMGNAHLTFEELSTLLVQVEAVLNSRPITPMSDNPNDLVPLTPAHFLIGKPMVAFPDRNVMNIPTN